MTTPGSSDRTILDGLRRAQDALHGGDADTASRVVDELLDRYGREAVSAARREQSHDQLGAELVLLETLGPTALHGDD
ncbi:hypothetical protein OG225_43085 (plasmid) [Nocardia sp. NBC_01377]|uniref:hypothetical protein n=1 Tax=Nocardia sp. NBC_01377 TaxID=2903595 RepID=UPI00324D6749